MMEDLSLLKLAGWKPAEAVETPGIAQTQQCSVHVTFCKVYFHDSRHLCYVEDEGTFRDSIHELLGFHINQRTIGLLTIYV